MCRISPKEGKLLVYEGELFQTKLVTKYQQPREEGTETYIKLPFSTLTILKNLIQFSMEFRILILLQAFYKNKLKNKTAGLFDDINNFYFLLWP